MKYFLLKGITPTISPTVSVVRTVPMTAKQYRIESAQYEYLPPGKTVVFRERCFGVVSIFVYERVHTFFLIEAGSQKKAYDIANSFRSILGIYGGRFWDYKGDESLVELIKAPRKEMKLSDILRIARHVSPFRVERDLLKLRLSEGIYVFHTEVNFATSYLQHITRQPRYVEALQHLSQSHSIISGHMTGSYYSAHYRYERKSESRYYREKMYLEFRTQYDLAFLSAFRGLEAVLGKSNFDKRDIPKLLGKLDAKHKTSFLTSAWKSYFETFSGAKRKRSYQVVIENFLKIRNAVAAHSNTNPPFILTEDQVFEIQRLVAEMLSEIVDSAIESENKAPSACSPTDKLGS